MKSCLSNLDRGLLRTVRDIGKQADRLRFPAYLVGGCVRDIILKRRNLDIDVVVEGNAALLAKELTKRWNSRLTVHQRFKTATLILSGGQHIDLAMARREVYARPGALPDVGSGNIKQDLFRRDFTINAMALAINDARFGRLEDEFGGQADLSGKKIRILHGKSFIDDPTRIIRAVRFEQRFGFHIERRTLSLMKAALKAGVFSDVTPARLYAEFRRLLNEPDPALCLNRLHQLDGLKFIDTRLNASRAHVKRLHSNIRKAQRKLLYKTHKGWAFVYFLGLMEKVERLTLRRILSKFPFTREERKGIVESQEIGQVIQRLSADRLMPSQVYKILKPLTVASVLYARACVSRSVVRRRIDHYLRDNVHARVQIDGEDLKRAGFISGRSIGMALQEIFYLTADRRVQTKKQQLDAAIRFLENSETPPAEVGGGALD